MQHKIRSIQMNSLSGRLEAEFLFDAQKDYMRTLTICVTDPVRLNPDQAAPPFDSPPPGVRVKCGTWLDFEEVSEMVVHAQATADALFAAHRDQWIVPILPKEITNGSQNTILGSEAGPSEDEQ